jgi:hypothetical protein
MSGDSGPPFVVAQIPTDGSEDPLFPSRLLLHAEGGPTSDLGKAIRYRSRRAARKAANRLMHYHGGEVYAEAVSFPIAWALANAARRRWPTKLSRRPREVRDG